MPENQNGQMSERGRGQTDSDTLEGRERNRFGHYVEKDRAAGLRAGQLQAQFTPLVAILVAIGTLLVVGVGGYVAAGNDFNLRIFTLRGSTIDVGTLILFLTYLKMLYQPMRDLSKLTMVASNAASGAERIQEVLDQAPEVIETATIYSGPQRLEGHISFEDVSFGYLKDQVILKGISLSIRAGSKVALVGYSGSGKTTLAKLVPRFYEINSGSLKIDGREVSQYPLQILRQNISLVLQDSVLFEGTVRENIEIGRPGASMMQIVQAAQKANIHETIMRLPGGYDTMVREQGSNFSAGQRQRLAIARAILRDTPILILDEPTANLDVESEAEVMHALNTLISGRTVLTISHRLSTLGKVDEIIVMSAGQIVERGTFKQLKKLGGVFTSLLEEQNRYNLDRDADDDTIVVRAVHPSSLPIVRAKIVAAPRPSYSYASTRDELADEATSAMTVVSPIVSPTDAKMTGYIARVEEHPPLAPLQWGGQPPDPAHSFKGRERSSEHASVQIQVNGQVQGVYKLRRPSMSIGRKSNSDIQIPSPRISRHHAKLLWKNGAWMIEDADSLNGLTWQNYRINQMMLSDGDRIYLDPSVILQYTEE
jgi:ABC-type multidrug transport system ATPase subunit